MGKSDNVLERIRDHTNGIGSAWTRKYKPIDVEKTIPNASPFAEDATVKEYMARYGIDNVRGGTYVTEHLSESEHHHLQQEIWAAKDCCKRCGRSGHFINTCHARTDVNGDEIDEEDEGSQDDNDSDDEDEDSDDYSEEEDSE